MIGRAEGSSSFQNICRAAGPQAAHEVVEIRVDAADADDGGDEHRKERDQRRHGDLAGQPAPKPDDEQGRNGDDRDALARHDVGRRHLFQATMFAEPIPRMNAVRETEEQPQPDLDERRLSVQEQGAVDQGRHQFLRHDRGRRQDEGRIVHPIHQAGPQQDETPAGPRASPTACDAGAAGGARQAVYSVRALWGSLPAACAVSWTALDDSSLGRFLRRTKSPEALQASGLDMATGAMAARLPSRGSRTGGCQRVLPQRRSEHVQRVPGHTRTTHPSGCCARSTFFHPDYTVGVGFPGSLVTVLLPTRSDGFDSRACRWNRPTADRELGVCSLTLPRRSLRFSCAYQYSEVARFRQVTSSTVSGSRRAASPQDRLSLHLRFPGRCRRRGHCEGI